MSAPLRCGLVAAYKALSRLASAPAQGSRSHTSSAWQEGPPSHRLRWILAVAGGSLAATLLADDRDGWVAPVSGDSGPQPGAQDEAQVLARLREWLRSNGVDMGLVDIRRSQAAEGAGLGMFVAEGAGSKQLQRCCAPARRSWWWPFSGSSGQGDALASFPLHLAITAANVAQDKGLGKSYAWMLERGVVDERTAVMVFLMVERLKGPVSPYAPWINALPKTFDTPIMYSPEELEELRGTPLYRAVAVVGSRLQQLWGQLQPAMGSMLAGQPGVQRQASLQDLLWAYNVFWSRAQSLPVPRAGSASRLLAQDPHALLDVQEGIVPGMDFCNHHVTAPQCWWEVTAPEAKQPAAQGAGAEPAQAQVQVQLRLYKGAPAKPGQELLISYGDKSNEELLMIYGFAVAGNPNDHIMLHCPLPPSSAWDEVMHARVELIRASKCDLQFFLPSLPGKASLGLPAGLLDTLEVFVLTPKELAERLQNVKSGGQDTPALDVGQMKKQKASMGVEALAAASQRLGLRMGALATLVKMLEARVEEQEGEGGTGTLEQDVQLLKQQAADSRGPAGRQLRQHACIVYRAEQKRIAREYLRMARSELQEVLSLLQDLGDRAKLKAQRQR